MANARHSLTDAVNAGVDVFHQLMGQLFIKWRA
jgi:hypothetical protein